MKGRLIVIEGLDGSGKSTQTELLRAALAPRYPLRFVKFPDYENPSSTLVKMYLAGEFGAAPGDVNAYAASTFYAVDRYASYKHNWGSDYEAGTVILCDRYVSSNAVHQTSKLPRGEWTRYLDWLYDFEYDKIAIPRPDIVVYLDMPVAVSQHLLRARYHGDEALRDIHERDIAYLNQSREAALFAADYLGWSVVRCASDGAPRPVEEIAQEIRARVEAALTAGDAE